MFAFRRALSCLVLAILFRSASEIVIGDETLPTSNSRFGDIRIPEMIC